MALGFRMKPQPSITLIGALRSPSEVAGGARVAAGGFPHLLPERLSGQRRGGARHLVQRQSSG